MKLETYTATTDKQPPKVQTLLLEHGPAGCCPRELLYRQGNFSKGHCPSWKDSSEGDGNTNAALMEDINKAFLLPIVEILLRHHHYRVC